MLLLKILSLRLSTKFLIDLLILDTHGDLNLYKEIWKRQEANELAPTGSCCDSIEPSTSGSRIEELPNVDFNLWAGELIDLQRHYH